MSKILDDLRKQIRQAVNEAIEQKLPEKEVLGKNGKISSFLIQMSKVDSDERPALGAAVNDAKERLYEYYKKQKGDQTMKDTFALITLETDKETKTYNISRKCVVEPYELKKRLRDIFDDITNNIDEISGAKEKERRETYDALPIKIKEKLNAMGITRQAYIYDAYEGELTYKETI